MTDPPEPFTLVNMTTNTNTATDQTRPVPTADTLAWFPITGFDPGHRCVVVIEARDETSQGGGFQTIKHWSDGTETVVDQFDEAGEAVALANDRAGWTV